MLFKPGSLFAPPLPHLGAVGGRPGGYVPRAARRHLKEVLRERGGALALCRTDGGDTVEAERRLRELFREVDQRRALILREEVRLVEREGRGGRLEAGEFGERAALQLSARSAGAR